MDTRKKVVFERVAETFFHSRKIAFIGRMFFISKEIASVTSKVFFAKKETLYREVQKKLDNGNIMKFTRMFGKHICGTVIESDKLSRVVKISPMILCLHIDKRFITRYSDAHIDSKNKIIYVPQLSKTVNHKMEIVDNLPERFKSRVSGAKDGHGYVKIPFNTFDLFSMQGSNTSLYNYQGTNTEHAIQRIVSFNDTFFISKEVLITKTDTIVSLFSIDLVEKKCNIKHYKYVKNEPFWLGEQTFQGNLFLNKIIKRGIDNIYFKDERYTELSSIRCSYTPNNIKQSEDHYVGGNRVKTRYFHPNKNLASEDEIVNDTIHRKFYDTQGMIIESSSYSVDRTALFQISRKSWDYHKMRFTIYPFINGVVDGLVKTYSIADNSLKSEITYVKGRVIGYSVTYEPAYPYVDIIEEFKLTKTGLSRLYATEEFRSQLKDASGHKYLSSFVIKEGSLTIENESYVCGQIKSSKNRTDGSTNSKVSIKYDKTGKIINVDKKDTGYVLTAHRGAYIANVDHITIDGKETLEISRIRLDLSGKRKRED